MGYTISISGNSEKIECYYYPPIQLEFESEIALTSYISSNTIPNVIENKNNLLHIGGHVVKFETGTYEIEDLNNLLQKKLEKSKIEIKIVSNKNTLKSEIYSNSAIDFTKENSIGSLLGFGNKMLEPNKKHVSDEIVKIHHVNSIRIHCNIVTNSFSDNEESKILYEFYPDVGSGYKIIEFPNFPIYCPLNTNEITRLVIKLLDQNNNPIDLRGETFSLRLHIRGKNDNF